MDHHEILSKIRRLEAIQNIFYALAVFFGLAFFTALIATGSVYSMILLGIMFILVTIGFGIGQKIISLCQEGIALANKNLYDLLQKK